MSARTLLVLPAYRESERLPLFLESLLPEIGRSGLPIDVLVVDDGSGPEESNKLEQNLRPLQQAHPFLRPILFLKPNQGKGAAITTGWNQVSGQDYLAFLDADGSCSGFEFLRLLSLLQSSEKTGALFASRIKLLGKTIDRSVVRHLIGRVYATLIGTLLKVPVYDSQCGLKVIRAEAWTRIHADIRETGFAFDVDLLMALLKHGVPVQEIPIDWQDTPGSKVHLLRDSFRMFQAVLRLRRRYQPAQ